MGCGEAELLQCHMFRLRGSVVIAMSRSGASGSADAKWLVVKATHLTCLSEHLSV